MIGIRERPEKIRRNEKSRFILLHVAVWVLGYWLVNSPWLSLTVGYFHAADNSLWLPSTYGGLINAVLFYGNWLYALPRFWQRYKGRYLLLVLVSLFGATLLETALDVLWANHVFEGHSFTFWGDFFVDNMLFHLLFVLLPSCGFWLYQRWHINTMQQQRLTEEKLRSELAALRMQIDSHFLFNVLNNLFSSARKSGDFVTADGINSLAHLMRYMLEGSKAERVDLEQEIAHVEAYVDLQKRRFHKDDQVEISIRNSIPLNARVAVAPLLFMPFVENAFKHGIRLQSASSIAIDWSLDAETLVFSCVNSLHTPRQHWHSDGRNSKIGLENVKKRLELLYPRQYQLEIVGKNGLYKVELKIQV